MLTKKTQKQVEQARDHIVKALETNRLKGYQVNELQIIRGKIVSFLKDHGNI